MLFQEVLRDRKGGKKDYGDGLVLRLEEGGFRQDFGRFLVLDEIHDDSRDDRRHEGDEEELEVQLAEYLVEIVLNVVQFGVEVLRRDDPEERLLHISLRGGRLLRRVGRSWGVSFFFSPGDIGVLVGPPMAAPTLGTRPPKLQPTIPTPHGGAMNATPRDNNTVMTSTERAILTIISKQQQPQQQRGGRKEGSLHQR